MPYRRSKIFNDKEKSMKIVIFCFALIISACGISTNKRLDSSQIKAEIAKQSTLRNDIKIIDRDLSKLPSDSLNDSERVYLHQFKEGLVEEYKKTNKNNEISKD